MNQKMKRLWSVILCFLLLIGTNSGYLQQEHLHGLTEPTAARDAHDHEPHAHDTAELLYICESALEFALSIFAVPVAAAYEDGVECEHCGGWRYDDWKCDNGDHCGEGADGDCYNEHHCGECGACVEDGGLCDDCEFCFECCVCEDKCRGCYEMGETVCSDCGEKCSGCDWICDDCGKCSECIGDTLYCSHCDVCIECADWVCCCGDGCSRCAVGCPDCREACSACQPDALCDYCFYCFDCLGGEGNYCSECRLCINCVDAVCYCGGGCSECTLICKECNEACENCADGGICGDCGTCADCAGAFCVGCEVCINCVDWICYCGEGCFRCEVSCPDCREVCSACDPDALCSSCYHCFECRGGEGDYCPDCGLCIDCVDMVCACGTGCSECVLICKDCEDKCENCADGGICEDCGTCFDCVGGDGNFCINCSKCKNCVDAVCSSCGEGCSECTALCPECNEKCMNCADDQICSECGVCFDCVGGDGNYCEECGICKNCVDTVCICGGGCSDCADICPECAEKCENCAGDQLCIDCGVCRDCVGEENFCADCGVCYNCVDMVCVCGGGCSNCTVICEECGEKCQNCSDGEICTECGICVDCAGSDSFCITCGLCSDCGIVCPCGEGCENCADLCPDCGEKCSSCCDEFCASCDICRDCADDLYCEDCGLCGDCTEICEDCGIVCADCAESVCEDCGKCSGCIDEFCPDCGICIDCADSMCRDCCYCGDCADNLCTDCGEYCADCAGFCGECGKCENCVTICPDCGMCEDCCKEAAEALECTHGICPESSEWKTHYCTEGGHCVGSSGKLAHDEDAHWTICGEGCDNRLNPEPHTFGEGKTAKEATKKKDGVMKFTCEVCGFSKEEVIPKLKDGHTHAYTDEVTAPTCASGGYTSHTCACGHTYTDTQTPAVKHSYVYKHTGSEHWQECEYCHTAAEKAAHKMGAWETTVKAGYTFDGEKRSTCKICDYAITEAIPALGIPDGKLVIILPEYDKKMPTESVPSGEKAPMAKELITKGTDHTVPALPVPGPTEDGNRFDGWVNKATGEPVKKGDKLTENIEIEPVWKDCGENRHADADRDNHCDECGYITVREVMPEETTASAEDSAADTGHEDEKTPKDHSDAPGWMILMISCFGGIIAVCGIVLAVVLHPAKKKRQG